MKTTVNRLLQDGAYSVNFSFTEFTPEELDKMRAFGVPAIDLQFGGPIGRRANRVPLTQINTKYTASFSTEEEAKAYELNVLSQARSSMESIRQRKDTFSSSEEVNI